MALSSSQALPLPPGSRGFPIVGETGDWARDPLRFAQERYERYGPVWRTHLLGRPCVMLLGPEANRFILSTHTHLFSSGDGWGKPITSLIGNGLSFLDGLTHRRHRSLIAPTLHGGVIGHYFKVMSDITAIHIEDWKRKETFKLFDAFKYLSFNIATRLMLGVEDATLLETLHAQFSVFTRGLFAPPAWRIPGLPYDRAWRAGQSLRRILGELIAARREVPDNTILGLLLTARDEHGVGLTDAEIVDEMLVLLWAGHDTITSLLTWMNYELLRHPTVLEQAREEQERVVAGGSLQIQHLKQFSSLDRIMRESERLHPPAPGGFRGVVSDFTYGGYRIPAGWTVMYSSVFTHHMPTLWHEPARFNPDRFAPPHDEGRKSFHLVGFGGGPRVCVGLAFAQMQMRIIMSHLLRTMRFELLPGQRFTPMPVPTKMPRDGLLVRATSLM